MQTHLRHGYLIAAGLLVLAGCSGDDGATSGGDAAVEDSAAPPGPDATVDAGSDAGKGHDAAGTDAGQTDGSSGEGAADALAHDAAGSDTGADTGAHDAGVDSSVVDSSTPDASAADASPDSGSADSGPTDDGSIDGAAADATGSDGATDAAAADAGDGAASLPAPLGAWGFDEGTGASSADLSGNGHAAVFAGGASWGAGKSGGGLVLDGTSGYADVGLTLVDTTKSFSVVSWMNLVQVSAWEIAVSEDDVNGSLFGLKLRGDGSNQFDFDVETSDVMSPGFAVAQSTTTAVASAWVHLAGVYDATGAGSMKLYVNGAPEATTAVGQAVIAASGHLLIGRGRYNGVNGSYLHGTVDQVAVYASALSDAQVAALYATQK